MFVYVYPHTQFRRFYLLSQDIEKMYKDSLTQ